MPTNLTSQVSGQASLTEDGLADLMFELNIATHIPISPSSPMIWPLLPRHYDDRAQAAVLVGPNGVGKSTLARNRAE